MKSNALTSILLGVFAVSAFASLILCGIYIKQTREARDLQGKVGMINYRQAAINQLIVDVVDYSKKTKDNKEIVQILNAAGVKEAPASAPVAK